MVKRRFVTLIFVVFLSLISACSIEPESDSVVEIDTGSKKIKVYSEVVETPETRAQGLMFREFLDEDAGMLFIWEDEEPRSFWMKNTLIPLDMIFISSDLRIIDIHHAVPCEADPCQTYPSAGPAQYVLEVNGGFTDIHGIKVGSVVTVR